MQPRSLISDSPGRDAATFLGGIPDRRAWTRSVWLACVCIAIFNGAHLAYRSSHAPDWFDVRLQLAENPDADSTPSHLGRKIHDTHEFDLSC